MASFNLTAEDSTPLISYSPSGAWQDSPANDTSLSSYSGNSLHTSSSNGATASFTFNGTGYWIYGGIRPDYGTYTIAVDGNTPESGTAQSDTEQFQQLLGSATGLEYGTHTVVMTNTGDSTAVDIDSIIMESQVGSAGDSVDMTNVDDSSSQLIYSPADAWSTNNQQEFINGTLHFTSTAAATASMTFSGDALAVYGTVSPDHSDIIFQIDGNSQTVMPGNGGLSSVLHTQTLLYYANNLGPGQHNLIVTNDQQDGTGSFMDLDSLTIYSTSGSGSSGDNSSASNGSTASTGQSNGNGVKSSSSGKISTGLLAGVIGGSVFILVVLCFLIFFLVGRRNKQKKASKRRMTPTLPIQSDALEANDFTIVASGPGFYDSEKPLPPSGGYHYERPQPEVRPEYRSQYRDSSSSFGSTAPMVQVNGNAPSSRLEPLRPPPARTSPSSSDRMTLEPDFASIYSGYSSPSRPYRPMRPPSLGVTERYT